MKQVYKFLVMLVVAAVFSLIMTGCLRQDYLIFEDGEFDGIEFSDYDLMHNAELDMDDTDRNWRLPRVVLIKIALCSL